MNTYSGTNTEAFKTAVSSVVGNIERYDVGSLLEAPDKKEVITTADNLIKKLLSKKRWTPQDAGQIYFYDYLLSINVQKEDQQQYDHQRKLIKEKAKQFCDSCNFADSGGKIYRLYIELFGWIFLACQRGVAFFRDLQSSCIILKNIIDTACSAEAVAKSSWINMPNEAKFRLCDMMLADAFDGDRNIGINRRQVELDDAINKLKSSVNNIAYHKITLDIIGNYADIQELKYFSFESRLFVLIDGLFSKAEKLERVISSNDCYGNKNISLKRSQTIRSILIDKLQPEKLMPLRSTLIDGTCHDDLYRNGFNISIEIDNERKLKKTQ
jgi:hypothetical protein